MITERLHMWLSRRKKSGDAVADTALARALSRDVGRVSAQEPETEAQWRRLEARIVAPAPASARTLPPFTVRRRAFALAFGVCAAVVLVAAVVYWIPSTDSRVYRTGFGQQSTILLPDSSEITLNHTSSLTVVNRHPAEGRQTLLDGEAFFRVRRNGTPFTVQTALGSVRVLGTEFNVRVRTAEMEVAVVGGKVRVTSGGGGRDSSVVISTGERTRISRGGFPDAPEATPFGAEYPGWLHGKLLLDRSTIAGACEELGAQFGVTIVIQRAELGGKTVTGEVEGRTVDEALRTFCALAHVAYRHENDRYILY